MIKEPNPMLTLLHHPATNTDCHKTVSGRRKRCYSSTPVSVFLGIPRYLLSKLRRWEGKKGWQTGGTGQGGAKQGKIGLGGAGYG